MAPSLHLLVRTVHVLGMAFLLGGSAAVWYALRTGRSVPLTTFEWVFWATFGAMLVTGVGNLGALGPPGPDTRWGTVLTVKLLTVLAFTLGSGLRTLVVVRLPTASTARPALRRLYAATTVTLLLLVTLAEVLAHG
jgi:hypothetical protein